MMPGSFQGTRTIGVTGWPFIAWKHCTIDWYSCTPCCMSTVTLSNPHCAITSAENPDGIASQAFTTALPEAQTFFTLFVIMFPSLCPNRRHCEERSDEAIQYVVAALDCFAEFIIGRRFAPTRWLAMTVQITPLPAGCSPR